MKKAPRQIPEVEVPLPIGKGVKFCVNCDDIDDMALDENAVNKEALRKRFQNCEKVGKFDGDVCSRLFIAEPGEEPGPIFEEDD
jgi:hypothetical protein